MVHLRFIRPIPLAPQTGHNHHRVLLVFFTNYSWFNRGPFKKKGVCLIYRKNHRALGWETTDSCRYL
ncbi:MAG: hypothetical protein A3I62_04260 [Betaproteobacteria bacterium RIFCSPLOWO2_02_FULL_62_79]|nr:MAG: hypothetical protein A3I62_04260 [Betaproteobacteria bacterium RIFCSPLOWO2_02_FULL_62_79]